MNILFMDMDMDADKFMCNVHTRLLKAQQKSIFKSFRSHVRESSIAYAIQLPNKYSYSFTHIIKMA